jgi:hypothetical protein
MAGSAGADSDTLLCFGAAFYLPCFVQAPTRKAIAQCVTVSTTVSKTVTVTILLVRVFLWTKQLENPDSIVINATIAALVPGPSEILPRCFDVYCVLCLLGLN